MIFTKKQIRSSFWVAFPFLIVTGFYPSFPDKPKDGFWGMKGTLIVHEFPDTIDVLSGQEIFELQDDNGLTIWFGRQIFKDVCMTGICNMIRLWIFWDGAGNYLGIQLPENEPLTKSDHKEFSAADYKKLDELLRDSTSILRDMEPRDLTVEDPTEIQPQYEVDGITAATPVGIVDVVVRDAVYTCYTLWHTVYGHTQVSIREILDQRVDHDFLALLFESDDPSYTSLAIKSVERHPEYHEYFYPNILSLIQSRHVHLSEQAINYLNPSTMANEDVQMNIIKILSKVNPNIQNRILWKFSELEKIHVDVVPELLALYVEQKISVGSLNLIYRMVKPEHLEDHKVLHLLDKLMNHENGYIRNLTGRLFNDNSKTSSEHITR
jgi:hypothetical protein